MTWISNLPSKRRKGILISLVYYVLGITLFYLFDFGSTSPHGPGLGQVFLVFVFLLGLLWGFIFWVAYNFFKGAEVLKGFYHIHYIAFLSFVIFVIVLRKT